jgi:peptidoglycan/LPS O-acetylase OafA/YrhL
MTSGVSRPVATPVAGQIPSLDGLRAISFLLVFVAHSGFEVIPGGLGVTIFFFLSGYLITTLMREEYARSGHVNLGHFWMRRALRILPPFYLVLLGAVALDLLVAPAATLSSSAIAAQALHLTNYWSIYENYAGEPTGTGVYWSLAVEEHFYLLFPLVYIMMQRRKLAPKSQALMLWGLCVVVLLWRCVLVWGYHVSEYRTNIATDTRIDSILFGCALAVWNNPVLDRPSYTDRIWLRFLLPAAAALMLLCLVIRDPVFRETVRYSLQGLALTYIFIAAIRFHDRGIFRVLSWRPLVFLGGLSYSLYLMHFVVLLTIERVWHTSNPLAIPACALLLSLAIAWAMYILVERPCARLRRRLTATDAATGSSLVGQSG